MIELKNLQRLETLSQTTTALKELGFDIDFTAQDGAILDVSSNEQYKPENVTILETYRFEGMSNPADNVLLLALECKNGARGSLVSAYATKHSQQAELLQRLKYSKEGELK